MFHALIAGKARLKKIIDGGVKRQPREDLITSALFGTITFLASADRRMALKALTDTDLPGETEIILWPYLTAPGEKSAEPDVVLKYQGEHGTQYWIVEVKWGAPLQKDQIGREINRVADGKCRWTLLPSEPRKVAGYTLLGKEDKHKLELETARKAPESSTDGMEIFDITWPDLTRKLRSMKQELIDRPGLLAWTDAAEGFLSGTFPGAVLREWPECMAIPKPTQFSFDEWPKNKVMPMAAHFRFEEGKND